MAVLRITRGGATKELAKIVRAVNFGDMHHIAADLLTNIFVNIFYIDFADKPG